MTDTLLTLLLVILWICSVWNLAQFLFPDGYKPFVWAVVKAFKWIGKW
jgi:hypothetical protein